MNQSSRWMSGRVSQRTADQLRPAVQFLQTVRKWEKGSILECSMDKYDHARINAANPLAIDTATITSMISGKYMIVGARQTSGLLERA